MWFFLESGTKSSFSCAWGVAAMATKEGLLNLSYQQRSIGELDAE
jgi:hypothetical protein